MRKLLYSYFMFFGVCIGEISGQTTFEKYYTYNGFNPQSNTAPVLINAKDSGYFIFSWNADSGTSVTNNFSLSVSRLNKYGEVTWSKNSDKYTQNYTWAYGSAILHNDSSFTIGWNQGYAEGGISYGGFVHLDKNGNYLWAKKYSIPYISSLHTPSIFIQAMQRTLDNGIICLGDYQSGYSDSTSAFLMKTDSIGNIKWCKVYYPAKTNGAYAVNLTVTSTNGLIVDYLGTDTTSNWGYGYLMETDSNGVPQWTRRYYSWNPIWARPQVVNGGIYTVGDFLDTMNSIVAYSYIGILRTNNLGIAVSCNYDTTIDITNSGTVYDGLTESDGSTLISGVLNMNSNSFIAKVGNAGNFIWANNYNKIDSLIITNLGLGLDSSVIGYGWNGKPSGKTGFGLVKTNKMGYDSCNVPITFSMVHHNITSQTTTVNTVSLNVITKDTILNFQTAPVDTLTVCYGHYIVNAGINIINNNLSVAVFPNPSTGAFTFTFGNPELVSGVQIIVYNMLGEKVYSKTLRQDQREYKVDLDSQPEGMYFYRIITDKSQPIVSGKLVKE